MAYRCPGVYFHAHEAAEMPQQGYKAPSPPPPPGKLLPGPRQTDSVTPVDKLAPVLSALTWATCWGGPLTVGVHGQMFTLKQKALEVFVDLGERSSQQSPTGGLHPLSISPTAVPCPPSSLPKCVPHGPCQALPMENQTKTVSSWLAVSTIHIPKGHWNC
jgi:hypothetical protein